jgi:hypothetical protein
VLALWLSEIRCAEPMFYGGVAWTRLPAYRALPDGWTPDIDEHVLDVESVLCDVRRARGCAHIPVDPHSGRPCIVRLAAAGQSPDAARAVYEHERMHCYGWIHR